jgi:hypothetical protein
MQNKFCRRYNLCKDAGHTYLALVTDAYSRKNNGLGIREQYAGEMVKNT